MTSNTVESSPCTAEKILYALRVDFPIHDCLVPNLLPFLRKYHPDGKYVFWPDQASSHYAKKVIDWFAECKFYQFCQFCQLYQNLWTQQTCLKSVQSRIFGHILKAWFTMVAGKHKTWFNSNPESCIAIGKSTLSAYKIFSAVHGEDSTVLDAMAFEIFFFIYFCSIFLALSKNI